MIIMISITYIPFCIPDAFNRLNLILLTCAAKPARRAYILCSLTSKYGSNNEFKGADRNPPQYQKNVRA